MKGVTLISHRSEVINKVDSCIKEAQAELQQEAVEWVQEQMLYGYHDPHGKDGHTEIWWPDRKSGQHMADTIKAEAKRDSQNLFTVSVGTPAPYAKHVYYGTHKLTGRRFLSDALEKHQGDQEKIYRKYLKKV